jgi:hypothetical protein
VDLVESVGFSITQAEYLISTCAYQQINIVSPCIQNVISTSTQ